jgi:hypothetical protein
MKATHNKNETPIAAYPRLMRSGELITLFTGEGIGVVVHGDEMYGVGHYATGWAMSEFTPLPSTESVTLQND